MYAGHGQPLGVQVPWRRNLRALGMPERAAREWAASQKGPWRIAGSYVLQRALPNAYWVDHGLKGFLDPYRRFRNATRTAGCGPACPGGVGGAGVSPAPTRSVGRC